MKKIDVLMKKAVAEGVFPGGNLLVSLAGTIVFNGAYGRTKKDSGQKVTLDTVFDLASLTKPLATAPALIRLIQENKISFDTRVADVLPLFSANDKADIRVINLLCHNSGLPAYRPYYKTLRNLSEKKSLFALKTLVLNEPLVNPVGEKVVYSDLGFMILGWIIEELAGISLDRYIVEKVYKPLHLNDLFFISGNKYAHSGRVFAATEECPWRKKIISGEVHDDNAWVVGGVAGHAGLFGTIADVHGVLKEYLLTYNDSTKGNFFDPVVLDVFLSEYNNTGRTPGFDMPAAINSSSGDMFSKNSVGHLGFTGTSFWMDLDSDIIIILLTNRVNPLRANIKIREFRPEIHNYIMRFLQKKPEDSILY